MYINDIISEAIDDSNLKKVRTVIKENPLGVGALLAALYTLYSKSKNKEDKIEAAINSFPEAAKKALIFLISAHGMKNILFGNVDMSNANKILNNTSQTNTMPNSGHNSSNQQTTNSNANSHSNTQSTAHRQQHVPKYKFVNGKIVVNK